MKVESKAKYMRVSADKVRPLMRTLKGLPVSEALNRVRFSPKKAAGMIRKVMEAAVADAVNNHQRDAEQLRVDQATVTDGPSQRRYWPTARGSAHPVRKRTSHLCVVLTDDQNETPPIKAAQPVNEPVQ